MATSIPGELLLRVGEALLCAMVVSFLMCPLVKSFAYKIGAIDVPKDSRRMHKKPTPRLGGLAIFLGFILSVLLFVRPIDAQLRGILLGSVIIVVLGVVDDIAPLRAGFKFIVQIAAALIAEFRRRGLSDHPSEFLEPHAYEIAAKIEDPALSAMHIMEA